MIDAGMAPAKSEVRRVIESEHRRVNDPKHQVTASDAIEGKFIVLRKGAISYSLVKLDR